MIDKDITAVYKAELKEEKLREINKFEMNAALKHIEIKK